MTSELIGARDLAFDAGLALAAPVMVAAAVFYLVEWGPRHAADHCPRCKGDFEGCRCGTLPAPPGICRALGRTGGAR